GLGLLLRADLPARRRIHLGVRGAVRVASRKGATRRASRPRRLRWAGNPGSCADTVLLRPEFAQDPRYTRSPGRGRRSMAVRPVRWLGACVLVLGLSGCGSGGDSSAPEAPSTPAADTDEPGTPSPSDVHVLHATDAGVKTTGSFDRIDGGPQAESAQVLRSVGDGTASAVFATAVPRTGYYELSLRWPQPE